MSTSNDTSVYEMTQSLQRAQAMQEAFMAYHERSKAIMDSVNGDAPGVDTNFSSGAGFSSTSAYANGSGAYHDQLMNMMNQTYSARYKDKITEREAYVNKYRSALWASRAERAAFEANPNASTYTAYLTAMRSWTKDPNFNLSGQPSGTASAAAEAVIAEQEKATAAAAAQKNPSAAAGAAGTTLPSGDGSSSSSSSGSSSSGGNSSDVSRRTGEGDLGDPLTDDEKGDILHKWDPEPDKGGMLPEPPEPDPDPGKKPPTDPGRIHFHPPDPEPEPTPTPTPTPKPPVTAPMKKPVPEPEPIHFHPPNATPPPIHRVPPRTTPASTETPAFHISETRGWKFVHSVALPEHKTLPSFMREYRDYGHTTDLAPMQAPPMLEERRGHGGGAMVHSDGVPDSVAAYGVPDSFAQPTVPPPSHELPYEDITGYEREASTITGMSPEDQDVADFTNESYTDPDQRQPMLHGAKYIRTMSTMHNAVYERGNQIYVAERGTDPSSWDDIKTDGKIIVQDGAGDATKDLSVDRQVAVLEQFDRVRRAYPTAHITLGGHSLANNLISHVLLNRDDRNVHAIGFNGLPHRQFNETHHKDVRYKHFHSRYDPVSYDPAANEQQTMPNNTIIPYYMKTGLSPHSMTHFMRESDRKRNEENIQKYATTSDSWFTRLKKAVATAVDDEPEPDEHGML